jgi:Phage Tail Collar Domain
MANRQFTNNATTILAGTISNTATVIQASTGEGALFPTLSGSEYFIVTMQDTSGNIEYMKCTGISGDNLTVVRGQEGSTAIGFTANLARFELRDTAGTMAAMYQKDGDTLTGPMNLGAQTVTNGVLGSGISMEAATEIVNTPIRGATGVTTNQITVPTNGTSRAQAGGLNILCAGDQLPVYTIGMVIMFHGALANIPAGWAPCDGGTYNGHVTANMTNRFPVGAGGTYTLDQLGNTTIASSAVSAGTPVVNSHTLITAEIPAHQHPFDYFFGSAVAPIGNPGFSSPGQYIFGGSGTGNRESYAGSSAGGGGGHTHTSAALAAHTHNVPVPFNGIYFIEYVGT